VPRLRILPACGTGVGVDEYMCPVEYMCAYVEYISPLRSTFAPASCPPASKRPLMSTGHADEYMCPALIRVRAR